MLRRKRRPGDGLKTTNQISRRTAIANQLSPTNHQSVEVFYMYNRNNVPGSIFTVWFALSRIRNPIPTLAVILILILIPLSLQAESICGKHTHPTGPFDYTNRAHTDKYLTIVEKHHFTEDVRTLRKGATTYLIGDLEYVLNWFPNHHQALNALTRLAAREGTTRPHRSDVDIECRFQWAHDIAPHDAMVYVIKGLYYARTDRNEEARAILQQAVDMAPRHPEIHYNLGLVLFRLKDYETARTHAEKAYELGYPLPGLKNMLDEAGYSLAD
ncbi:MAG: tetratricopeptide repeat protein [Pseudohongiellaceae bacterium]